MALNIRSDRLDRTVDIVDHPSRRYPQRSHTTLQHPGVAYYVPGRLVAALMALAIDLDREARRWAEEIENVGPQRVLAAKSKSIEFRAP